MYDVSSDGWLPYSRRISIAEAYWDLVEDQIGDGYVGYFANFMFNQLPGTRKTQIEIMKSEISRVVGILTQQVVRKPQSESWKLLKPRFVGCSDLPVPKSKKLDADVIRVNDGLHFNGFLLVPPRRRASGGKSVRGARGRKSRLKVGLIRHFELERHRYLTPRLARVHLVRIRDEGISDYPFQIYLSGKISGDDFIVI